MTVTSIRFPENVYNKIKEAADFSGLNVTAYMRDAIIEKIEDQEDYAECVKEAQNMTETVSREEVMKEVFGDEDK
ncbi:DUF6290 family protein [Lactobacillus sp. ESL0677]|uniref:type II toxin-antitoxin system RelB family antitoxin n=1 Tax=Lactobacillus sp. ESL0677 TaxID=2983208 RepID=UPI0023FA2085|nr:DUF6290 family protein [Lactobacillus sp. ESL0677]WEV36575.1 DUF6290 family protein [Lactobacillus sp. ESL0677]